MSCGIGVGATHYQGCACHEAAWAEKLAAAEAQRTAYCSYCDFTTEGDNLLVVRQAIIDHVLACPHNAFRVEADKLSEALRHAARELQYIADEARAEDAALRLALETATRERDDNANVILEQNKLWADRCEAAERERDEARAAMDADDRRLREAAVRVWGEHVRGCDTPDAMADLIEHLRAERDAALSTPAPAPSAKLVMTDDGEWVIPCTPKAEGGER